MIEPEQPTGHLRFIDRDEDIPGPMSGLFIHQTTRVLQQRWRITRDHPTKAFMIEVKYEWRDVPIEVEAQ